MPPAPALATKFELRVKQLQLTNLIPHLRSGTDHSTAYPMQRLQVLLFDGFAWHKPHIRTAHGFADRLRTVGIVFL